MAPPPCDTALEAAVKAEEKKTGEKAPYFGADSRDEALELGVWKRIGKAWKNRAPKTCFNAYVARYGNERKPAANKDLYTAAAKEEVLRGERDSDLKKAAGRCYQLDLNVYKCTNQFFVKVDCETVRKRLVVLDYKSNAATWAADLDAEVAALKGRYKGRSFVYEDHSKHRVEDVGFYGKHPEPVAFCVCVEVGVGDEFEVEEEWTAEFNDLETWFDGGVVEEAEAPEPTPLPSVPDPPAPAPAPAPTTRLGKRAAALSARYAAGAHQTNKKARKKAAADADAWEAEKKNDVVATDASYRHYEPSIDSVAGDARALAVNIPERLAALGVAKLLDPSTVSTQLPHRRRRLSVLRGAVDVARSRRYRRAPTRRAPPNYAAFTQDHQPLLAEARAGRGNAAGAPRRAGAHPRRRREVRGRPRRLDAAPRRGLLRAADPPRRPRETRPVPRHGRGDG